MSKSRILNVANVSLNTIRENKILSKISESIVVCSVIVAFPGHTHFLFVH